MLRPADHTLFAGDLSALPAIRALAATLPAAARATVLVSITDASDIVPIESPALLSVHWLDQSAGDPDLRSAVRALRWPAGSLYAWIAGENAAVVDLRAYLRAERGLPASMIYATPYWKSSLDEEAYHEERHRVMDAMELA
jgi:NADPH-dependent ferric siderophore reductase